MGKIKAQQLEEEASDNQTIDLYFMWLSDTVMIGEVGPKRNSYWFLAKQLYKKGFFWTVPNDDNRGVDGTLLREKFEFATNFRTYKAIDRGPCNMLEMLVALAERVESAMIEPKAGDQTVRWFWEMMANCGLDKYTDEAYVNLNGMIMVDEILNKILERTYHRNGDGGLFPLKDAKKDQRKVEIWYQMSAYLLENYYSTGKNM